MKVKSILLTALATISIATEAMAQVPNYVPTNGLVGWWPFNGNANDESGNGNNGAVNGAVLTTDRLGVLNNAYSFDGNSNSITIADDPVLNNNYISISAWFRTNFSTPGSIIYKTNASAINEQYACVLNYPNPNEAIWSVKNGNNCNNPGIGWQQTLALNQSLSDGNWHNIICTYDGSLSQIFIDGALLFSSTFSIGIIDNCGGEINIGKGYNSTYLFNGKLDDIGIWNRALTQQEITDLYNGNICYQTITVTDTLLINMGVTGFNPVTYNNTIKIFPNPTNDHITIDYGNFASLNGYQLKIENSLGQQVFQTGITQQSDYLNLTTWGGNGIYFVHIIDTQGNTIDIRKIVLQ